MKPTNPILSRSFRYTSAAGTNIKRTFARELKRLAEAKAKQEALDQANAQELEAKLRRIGGMK